MNKKIDISNVVLKTSRLTLRAITDGDLNDFYEYASRKGVGESAGWAPHKSIEESKQILEMLKAEKSVFSIIYNGKMIGTLGIDEYDESLFPEYASKQGREIGFVINNDYWNRGIVTEATKEIIRFAFEDLNLDFLLCSYFSFNKASKSVQRKCGFRQIKVSNTNSQTSDETYERVYNIILKETYQKRKNLRYEVITKDNLEIAVNEYVNYFNNYDNGVWKLDKATKRISQMAFIPDSYSLLIKENNNNLGIVLGYYKEYDDITIYYLEEILIFKQFQNKGYGTIILEDLENTIRKQGAKHMELISINDQFHNYFYSKLGYYDSSNLLIKAKHFEG